MAETFAGEASQRKTSRGTQVSAPCPLDVDSPAVAQAKQPARTASVIVAPINTGVVAYHANDMQPINASLREFTDRPVPRPEARLQYLQAKECFAHNFEIVEFYLFDCMLGIV